jgi:hypothetical protein
LRFERRTVEFILGPERIVPISPTATLLQKKDGYIPYSKQVVDIKEKYGYYVGDPEPSRKRDFENALKWAQNNTKPYNAAAFDVAWYYERGFGVAQNLQEAYFWYSLNANGRDAAASLAKKLTAQQIKDVEKRLVEWRHAHPNHKQ